MNSLGLRQLLGRGEPLCPPFFPDDSAVGFRIRANASGYRSALQNSPDTPPPIVILTKEESPRHRRPDQRGGTSSPQRVSPDDPRPVGIQTSLHPALAQRFNGGVGAEEHASRKASFETAIFFESLISPNFA